MTGRVYLDWNATAPLRPEARAAMLAAMDVVGNPSSVHAEGRQARAIVERARGQVAALAGCEPSAVVFTSGATEAAAAALSGAGAVCAEIEHDAVLAWAKPALAVSGDGLVGLADGVVTRQRANSETGVVQAAAPGLVLEDAVQAVGKLAYDFAASGALSAAVSAHKLGGPKGVGALILGEGLCLPPLLAGGGQEMGRRAGTENVIGIAGFGAAAEAAGRDLDAGVWDGVEKLREILESALADFSNETIFVGKGATRLPNTCCALTPGWKGETQVMAMDLAGFAISAGSACSSGKVRPSRVLRAMGFGEVEATSAIRVSLGPDTTEAEVLGFARAWGAAHGRWKARAA